MSAKMGDCNRRVETKQNTWKDWKWVSLGFNCMPKGSIRALGLSPAERLPFDFTSSSESKAVIEALRSDFAGRTAENVEYVGIHIGNDWPTFRFKPYPSILHWHDLPPARSLLLEEPRFTLTTAETTEFVADNARRGKRLLDLFSDTKEDIVALRADIETLKLAVALFNTVRAKTKGNLYLLFFIRHNAPFIPPPGHTINSAAEIHPTKNTYAFQRLPSTVDLDTFQFGQWLSLYLAKLKTDP